MVLAAAQVAGQTSGQAPRPYNPFIEEEAPPALISLDRTDAEVDLYVLGSWLARSSFATGLALHPPLPESGRRVTFPYEYPGFETDLFSQTLDLVLSLWLYNRYFFEASFADDAAYNTFATGYVAVDDELVQELVVGNVPLAISPYPYQYAGSPGGTRAGRTPRPGAVLRLQTARTYHELLLQLENSRLETRRFSGGGMVEEVRLRPEDYLRSGVYLLPHAPVRNLVLYVEDRDGSVELTSGSGRRTFRVLDSSAGDYVADSTTGLVRLGPEIPRDVTIAAAYDPLDPEGVVIALDGDRTPTDRTLPFPLTGNAPEFENVDGGGYGPVDLYRFSVTAGAGTGTRGVLLQEPGRYSPFAAGNHYELPGDAHGAVREGTARIRMVRRGTRTPAEEEKSFLLEPVAQGTMLQVLYREGGAPGGASPAPITLGWKYPFAEIAPRGRYAAMYGPRSHPRENLSGIDILLEYRADEQGLFLDGDVVPGTVSITRNGRPLPGAEIDYATGEVLLPETSDSGADVDVRYRVYTPDGGIGDVVAISGNRWSVTDSLLLSAAAGVRWTVTQDTYSTELEEHPGQVTASLGIEHRRENFFFEAAAAVQVYQPDTTGFMRLFGGEAEVFSIAPRETTLFPASLPADASLPPLVAPFDATRRAIAPYRDHWSTGTLGDSALSTYTTSVAADRDREGARMGPYLARSTDGAFSGTVGVLEWRDMSPGEWVGASIRVTSPPADLRDARRLSFTYRYVPGDGEDAGTGTELVIQLGALEEDLDGDGRAARGRSAVDPTFEFTFPPGHPQAGAVRRVGQDAPGLAAPHREDPRRDGILRQEIPESVFNLHVDNVATGGTWRTHEITLTPKEAEALGDLRALRVLVRNAGAGTEDDTVPAGRLLLGDIKVERAGNATVTAGRDRGATVSIGSDPAALVPGQRTLRESRSVVKDRFNPDDADQPVLELSWTDAGGPVEAAFSIPDFSPDLYGTLVFYLYLRNDLAGQNTPPGETVTVSLLPYANAHPAQALTVEIPAAALYEAEGTGAESDWREVRVNLDSGAASMDGAVALPRASLPRDSRALLRLATVNVSGVSAPGTLFFDELHATDPQAGTATAGRIGMVWETELGPGRLTLEQDLAAQTAGFRSSEPTGASTGTAGAVAGRSSATYRQNRFLLGGEASYRVAEEESAAGALGHSLVLPIGPAQPVGLVLEEEFLRDFDPRVPLADRRFGVSLGTSAIGRYRFDHRHRINDRELFLRWSGLVSPPAAGPAGLSLRGSAELNDLDRRIESGDYAESWLRTGRYIIPPAPGGEETRQERRLEGRAGLDLHTLNILLSAGWNNRSDTAGTQESTSSVDSSLPLEFGQPGRRPWTLTPGYRRAWRVTDRRESGSFNDDFEIWHEAFRQEPVVLTAIPLAELFQPMDGPGLGLGDLDAPREARLYEPEARLRFSRAFASRPRDLWVPSDVEALLRRTTSWEADSLTDRRTWQMTLTAVAINLFGVQGSTPLVPWYLSDEFRNRVLLSLTEQVPGEITRWQVELRNDSLLIGFSENELTLTNSVSVQGGDQRATDLTSAVAYVWRRPGYPSLAVFERMEQKPYYRHTERLRVTAAFREGEFSASEITLGHETALVVGLNGEFRLFADLGWIVDPAEYDEGALHLVGFQTGLEGVLKY
ncbi:MAG: hypothetical protein EA427_12555 [Spirochaetaceae bacterium]|nr:MAG: hypothetical protein EA427_12555 [Spirochaetaceae bacterium]